MLIEFQNEKQAKEAIQSFRETITAIRADLVNKTRVDARKAVLQTRVTKLLRIIAGIDDIQAHGELYIVERQADIARIQKQLPVLKNKDKVLAIQRAQAKLDQLLADSGMTPERLQELLALQGENDE